MKKYLKFAGLCSLVLAVVAFILMMATTAINGALIAISGTEVIFGDDPFKPAPLALLAWIFGLIGMLIILLGVIIPFLKVKTLAKFAGLLNLIAVGLLVIAGVFMFIVLPSYYGAQGYGVPNNAGIGAGWVIGGILYILAGAVAILPAAMDFIAKK